MPQAIKHFNGTVRGTTDNNIYTCPASTIAIVLPSISIMGSSTNGFVTIGWNSSTSVSNTQGNLYFSGIDSDAPYLISHTSKYDVQVSVRTGSTDSTTHYSPSFTTNLSSTQYAWNYFAGNSLTTSYQRASAFGTWAVLQPTSTNTTLGTAQLRDFRTGAWSMSAGHKLGIDAQNNSFAHYSFLIIEEAA